MNAHDRRLKRIVICRIGRPAADKNAIVRGVAKPDDVGEVALDTACFRRKIECHEQFHTAASAAGAFSIMDARMMMTPLKNQK